MNVNVKESTMIRPAQETPRHCLWLSRLDMILREPKSHSPITYIYRPNKDQNKYFDTEILKESLSRVLVPFYPIAGRLKKNEENDRIEIDCNAAGVLFVVAETTHTLAEFEGFKPTTEFRTLVMPTWDYSSSGLSSFPLLMVRVTYFKCGGVCFGIAGNHHVADGVGQTYLINSWSRFARGLDLDVQPFFDRTSYLSPRHPPQVKFQHLEYEPPLPPPKGFSGDMTTTRECLFNLSKCQINSLKLQATTQGHMLSTYAVLAGHVWRSACKARGLKDDQYVKLYIPTDGRSRFKDPPLPQGYFGNVVFLTACIGKACDITCNPLCYASNMVQEAIKRMDNMDYIRSAIDYLESQPDLATLVCGSHSATSPNLWINSWGRIPFYEADFGWGKPEFVGHGGNKREGKSFLVPSLNGDGSFSLNINLLAVHMPLFENYLYDF